MTSIPDKLFNSRLIVEPIPKEEEVIGSIVIPVSVNAKLLEGRAIKVAEDIKDVILVGEVVLFPEGCGVGQFFDKKQCIWLTAQEVWGVYTKDEK